MSWYKYVLNTATNEIHRAVMDGDKEFSREQCNLDDMLPENRETVASPEPFLSSGYSRCGHCWPPMFWPEGTPE